MGKIGRMELAPEGRGMVPVPCAESDRAIRFTLARPTWWPYTDPPRIEVRIVQPIFGQPEATDIRCSDGALRIEPQANNVIRVWVDPVTPRPRRARKE